MFFWGIQREVVALEFFKKGGIQLKRYLLAWFVLSVVSVHALATPESTLTPRDGVRFDAQITPYGYTLVARGRPAQPYERVQASFEEAMKELCADAKVVEGLKHGEYEYLEGGGQYLMPVSQGVFIPWTENNTVRMAPSIFGQIVCATPQRAVTATGTLPPPARLVVESRLNESAPYIDQGFGASIREKLDVPLNSGAFAMVIDRAVKSALLARGYNIDVVTSSDREAARLVFTPMPVSGEQFDGLAMLTKIGLLGITNKSFAFCSFEIAVASRKMSKPQAVGMVSTRKDIPAIYSSWKQDMANGPSEKTHSMVVALLSKTLETNIRAAIHALPSQTIKLLFDEQGQ